MSEYRCPHCREKLSVEFWATTDVCPNCVALRNRVEELDARVLELLWDRFEDCPCPAERGNEAGDWYMPVNSGEEEACAELHERGLLEKHPEKDWFKRREAGDET